MIFAAYLFILNEKIISLIREDLLRSQKDSVRVELSRADILTKVSRSKGLYSGSFKHIQIRLIRMNAISLLSLSSFLLHTSRE